MTNIELEKDMNIKIHTFIIFYLCDNINNIDYVNYISEQFKVWLVGFMTGQSLLCHLMPK